MQPQEKSRREIEAILQDAMAQAVDFVCGERDYSRQNKGAAIF